MNNNIHRLMHTITSIMDLSRLESGNVQPEKFTFDLRDVLQQVSQDMESMVLEKGLALEFRPPSTPLRVTGDKNMLYRLFTNLISNSLKFTTKGKIGLRAYRYEDIIRVEVSDTGIGIEKEDLATIFERFVQKTASSLGIGVGLTICRDIANLHDGKIWAESAGLDQGAIIKVELPAVE